MSELTQVASVVIITVILSELVFQLVKRSKVYDVKDSLVNLFIGLLGSALMKGIWTGLMFAGFTSLFALTPLRLDASKWWYWPLALIVSDFCYYWYHRFGHELRIFWGTHSIHHSSEDYNLSTSVRLSWLESSFRWIFWAPVPLMGVAPVNAVIAYFIIRYYQVWLHTRKFKSIPVFEQIFTVPSHHRVHHGTNPQYIDKNYGGCLIIWDKLFGTFQKEEEAVVYGVLKPIETYNPIRINFDEYVSLIKDVWNEPSWINKLRYIYKKPGWNPSGEMTTEEELFQQKLAMGEQKAR